MTSWRFDSGDWFAVALIVASLLLYAGGSQ
jgi:hypothetical protein